MSAKFDTLRYAKELESSGVARDLAVKQAELLHEEVLANVATKQDLALLRQDLALLEQRIETKLAAMELRLTLRMGAMLIAAVGILIAVQKLL